jgi:hypothetical protein
MGPTGRLDCDTFSDANLARIAVQPEEIAEHRLVELRTVLTMLRKARPATSRRAP